METYTELKNALRRMTDAEGTQDANFDPSLHPRGGDPKNKGRFSKGNGAGGALGRIIGALRVLIGAGRGTTAALPKPAAAKTAAAAAPGAKPEGQAGKKVVVWATHGMPSGDKPREKKSSGVKFDLFGDMTLEEKRERAKRRKAEEERRRAEAKTVTDRFGRQTKRLTNNKGEGTAIYRPQHNQDFWNKVIANGYHSDDDIASETESEYRALVESGDYEAAQEMILDLADKLPCGENVAQKFLPYISCGELSESIGYGYRSPSKSEWAKTARMVVEKALSGDTTALGQIAKALAAKIPKNAVLIPIPDGTGRATVNLALAKKLGQVSGAEVVDGLEFKPRADGLSSPWRTLSMHFSGKLPQGKRVIFVTATITSGEPERAARTAVGGGTVLTYANGIVEDDPGYQAKNAAGVVERNGKTIPLSWRFDRRGEDAADGR